MTEAKLDKAPAKPGRDLSKYKAAFCATAPLLKPVGIGGRRDIFEIREDEREAIQMTSDDQVFEKNGRRRPSSPARRGPQGR